jgi:3-methyladenine DNA glycosylase AlkC
MPEPFKLHFNPTIIKAMAQHINSACQSRSVEFAKEAFIEQALLNLDELELKARSNQIMDALLEHMPVKFPLACSVIVKALAPNVEGDENIQFQAHNEGLAGWMMMPVTDYIAASALEHNTLYIDEALETLHACTQRFSAEFSIRPFLRDHTTKTLDVLKRWAVDENVHVRRLASEGSRPYLPWGLRLNVFVQNPELVLPLLEQLKDDPSEYVRRSVANNLNDIAKDHPDLVANIATDWWDVKSKQRTKLIRHACRTLLKNGHKAVLALFGFPPANLANVELHLKNSTVEMGQEQVFELNLENHSNKAQNLIIDYAMFHQKANGKMLPKVFKWTTLLLPADSRQTITKRHSFKAVTTRKYYRGQHKVQILINGKAFVEQEFDLG